MTDLTSLTTYLPSTETLSSYFTNISTVASENWTLYATTSNLAYLGVGLYSVSMAIFVPLVSFYGVVVLTIINVISKTNWFAVFKVLSSIPSSI